MWTSPHRIKVWFKPPLWGCCSWLILWQTLVKHRLSGHLRNKLRIEPSLSLVHGIYVPGSQLELKPSSEAKLHFWSEGCATHKAEEQAHQAGNSLGVSLIKDGFFSPIGWVHLHCPHISWFGFVVVCGWFLFFCYIFFLISAKELKESSFKLQDCSKRGLCINKRFTRFGGKGLTRWKKI